MVPPGELDKVRGHEVCVICGNSPQQEETLVLPEDELGEVSGAAYLVLEGSKHALRDFVLCEGGLNSFPDILMLRRYVLRELDSLLIIYWSPLA